jgi:2-polyprenyl-3-methyl-5-hydroxy-6-metoxy-1,4-benzoquinol methylase
VVDTKNTLDVGCGSSLLAIKLALRGSETCGGDIAQPASLEEYILAKMKTVDCSFTVSEATYLSS